MAAPSDKESQAISAQSRHTDLVSKLPAREGWSQPLVLYNNYWLRPQFAENIMRLQNSFKARSEDTILACNPKCGTTWLKALAFAITSRSMYDFEHNHPLLSHHPQELVPFMEIVARGKDLTYVETLPSPRLLATHMPLSLLPECIAASACRIVCICREPKDAFVSRWKFENKILVGNNNVVDLQAAFSMFCDGFSPYGPFWDHCLEYWRESISKPDKVLFIKYEDKMSEPMKYVVLLAEFLGLPFTKKEHEDRVPEEMVRLCSFEKLRGLHANQNEDILFVGPTWLSISLCSFGQGR